MKLVAEKNTVSKKQVILATMVFMLLVMIAASSSLWWSAKRSIHESQFYHFGGAVVLGMFKPSTQTADGRRKLENSGETEGRDAYQFFTKQLDDEMHRHVLIEDNLRNAVSNNEFIILFQPQIDARNNNIIGFEVLTRWHSPQLENLSRK